MHPKDALFDDWHAAKKQLLYETDTVMVFIANICRTPGHLLVVPKQKAFSMSELDKQNFVALWEEAYNCVALLKKKIPTIGVVVAQNEMMWQADPTDPLHVRQVHVHVIPSEGLDFSRHLELNDQQIDEIKERLSDRSYF